MRSSHVRKSDTASEARVARSARWTIFAAAALLAGCGDAPAKPRNVVLICFDTVRADHLGPYGYTERPTTPFLDRFAESAIVFTDATATAGWTKPSVPSFMTGLHPSQHGVYEGSARMRAGAVSDVLPEAALTLAEVFQSRGYDTGAFIRNAQLRRGSGIEQGFETYEDRAGDAREIRWSGLDWLDAREDDAPFFLYLHYLDAHWPYPVPDEYATMFAAADDVARFRDGDSRALRDAINDGDVELTAADREAMEALYDGAIRYLDDQLALLVAGLEQRGLLEDTVLCIVSDHGEEFGEHGRIGHGHGLWEGLLRVPWVLRLPEGAGRRVSTPVSLVDLFPTLLAAAAVRGDAPEGSVDRLADPDRERTLFAEHKAPDRYEQSLRSGASKVVRAVRVQGAEVFEFPVDVGTRWEAELALEPTGELLALQLKPRDDDTDDPLELKGPIERLAPGELSIAGVTVRYDEDTRLAPVEGADPALRRARYVKVRGVVRDGAVVAEWIKIYVDGTEDGPPELRGTVERVTERDGLRIVDVAGLPVRATAATTFKDVDTTRKPRLERATIVRLLEEGVARAAASGEAEVSAQRFRLDGDADELSPLEVEPDDALLLELDRIGRESVGGRVFDLSDTSVLTPEELEQLRAIGYAD